jgi:hypothetical protein
VSPFDAAIYDEGKKKGNLVEQSFLKVKFEL